MHLGIDEAGRGPVLGPMVMAGVWTTPTQVTHLEALGLKDSKAYGSSQTAQKRRMELATAIQHHVTHYHVVVISAQEIDSYVLKGQYNQLEQNHARHLIQSGPQVTSIVADGARLFGPLVQEFPHLQAINRADSLDITVSAASILAKVERDKQLHALLSPYQTTLGPIGGGGYVNRATQTFLERFVENFGTLPPQTRKSWSWPPLQTLIHRLNGTAP